MLYWFLILINNKHLISSNISLIFSKIAERKGKTAFYLPFRFSNMKIQSKFEPNLRSTSVVTNTCCWLIIAEKYSFYFLSNRFQKPQNALSKAKQKANKIQKQNVNPFSEAKKWKKWNRSDIVSHVSRSKWRSSVSWNQYNIPTPYIHTHTTQIYIYRNMCQRWQRIQIHFSYKTLPW